jgi:integrase
MVAEQILADYDASDDRTFKRKYVQYVRGWIADLARTHDLKNSSIRTMVGAVKSFFKYNDLPLGLVPQAASGIFFHNRDITKEEIVQIMALAKIREKAFFAVMAQSGLRPHTIQQLRLKNLERFEKAPCKIEVSKEITKGKYGSYVSFIGSDAVKYLKQY